METALEAGGKAPRNSGGSTLKKEAKYLLKKRKYMTELDGTCEQN